MRTLRAGEQGGEKLFQIFRIGQGVTARPVQRQAEARLAGGGDGGAAPGQCCHFASQLIGAAVTAEKRHDGSAVLGYGENRRFACLVGQQGGQNPDEDAAGAHADDGLVGAEALLQLDLEFRRGGAGEAGPERRGNAFAKRSPGGAEYIDDGRHRHGRLPL